MNLKQFIEENMIGITYLKRNMRLRWNRDGECGGNGGKEEARFRHIEAFGCLENLATVCQENVGREKEKIEERVVWEDLTAYI
jgi:hypothetical protein